jgi:hypothetical protein
LRRSNISDSYIAAPYEGLIASTADRTKMLHVKHFGTIEHKGAGVADTIVRAATWSTIRFCRIMLLLTKARRGLGAMAMRRV